MKNTKQTTVRLLSKIRIKKRPERWCSLQPKPLLTPADRNRPGFMAVSPCVEDSPILQRSEASEDKRASTGLGRWFLFIHKSLYLPFFAADWSLGLASPLAQPAKRWFATASAPGSAKSDGNLSLDPLSNPTATLAQIMGKGTRFFKVKFRKRTDGTIREMLCRRKVQRYSASASNFARLAQDLEHQVLTVWDVEKFHELRKLGKDRRAAGKGAYRRIPLDGVIEISGVKPDAILERI